MLGTIVNTITVIVCSLLGLFIKVPEKYEKSIVGALGLSVALLGASGAVKGLNQSSPGALLFIIYIALGTVIGEFLKIDERFNRFGEYLGRRAGNSGAFAKGFITASLIYCVGAMSIIGPFEGGLTGNHSIVYAKSVLDGVMSVILASMYGVGVMFSAIIVFFYQGFFAVLAGYLAPIITDASINELSAVGNALITAIGLDMLGIVKLKYANMLPAIFLPIIYYSAPFQSLILFISVTFG